MAVDNMPESSTYRLCAKRGELTTRPRLYSRNRRHRMNFPIELMDQIRGEGQGKVKADHSILKLKFIANQDVLGNAVTFSGD